MDQEAQWFWSHLEYDETPPPQVFPHFDCWARFIDEIELERIQKYEGIFIPKTLADDLNEILIDFYRIDEKYHKTHHKFYGIRIDIYPTDSNEDIKELAEWYSGVPVNKFTFQERSLPLDELFSDVIPFFSPEERNNIVNKFQKLFSKKLNEQPQQSGRIDDFDDDYDTSPFYLTETVWIIRFREHSLFVSFGSDE